ncbi:MULTISPECIES: SRPBCC domain-containing protein [unclassified Amycolatopsis]|uniref:SRPBCC family protein n=1 Tax=unclassified Amycolatopsis TaxID=2618356 RepID=UPI002874B18D|nr:MULTISPECIES: SRPBCC domain-containing protein [unclassified Amycolatopsis]MDS0136738.1 SRPBCC domain-containing protein [Amycolatopsis sp. 505]MDS0143403.1 SRPBCC domain-containing protein [Amycolatopsis sp. CM201R]
MGYEFELTDAAEVGATPEQVWEAIATGPGIDSWFMGRNEVEGGSGGTIRGAFGAYRPEFRISEWDPAEKLAYGSDTAPDGRRIAYEFLIEGRGGGSTVLRCVTSGFLPGDDWEDEFEAMTAGGDLFFRTLVEYVTHFVGRKATPVTAFGPPVADWDEAWTRLGAELGLPARPSEGDRVRLGGGGVVYAVNDQTVGIRTPDAMFRFVRGFQGAMVACHHLFAPGADADVEEKTWGDWLNRVLG